MRFPGELSTFRCTKFLVSGQMFRRFLKARPIKENPNRMRPAVAISHIINMLSMCCFITVAAIQIARHFLRDKWVPGRQLILTIAICASTVIFAISGFILLYNARGTRKGIRRAHFGGLLLAMMGACSHFGLSFPQMVKYRIAGYWRVPWVVIAIGLLIAAIFSSSRIQRKASPLLSRLFFSVGMANANRYAFVMDIESRGIDVKTGFGRQDSLETRCDDNEMHSF